MTTAASMAWIWLSCLVRTESDPSSSSSFGYSSNCNSDADSYSDSSAGRIDGCCTLLCNLLIRFVSRT
uniref:MIP09840p n=1 Tax=Drosophila melanogaster TaxID=7227 RepID=C0PVD6_DROME|nr:MIP09840p [Drosophila melanogaster]